MMPRIVSRVLSALPEGNAPNAACIPPVDPNCMSTQLASCLDDGQQGGPTCVPTAASAIDGCAAKFPATTCSDYCTTSTSGKICLAPCIWLC